jgi:predicted outer membrane protein
MRPSGTAGEWARRHAATEQGDAGDAAAVTMLQRSSAAPSASPVDLSTATVSNGQPVPDSKIANDVPSRPAIDLSDAQILEVAHVANRSEVEQAKLAESKGRDLRVKKLAAMMAKDPLETDREGMALAKKMGLTPSPSLTSTSLEADTKDAASALEAATGSDLDKGYAHTQVKEQAAVLQTVEERLMPSAMNTT